MVKKAAYGLLAAFLAAGVYGAIPTTAEGWYTPRGGFSAASGTGTIYYGYDTKTGQWQTKTVTVDDKGKVTGGDVDFKHNYELMTAYQALKRALGNEAVLANHDEAIETLGKNLHALTSKDGIHIRNENTGQEFTIKFGGSIASAVSGASGDIPATSDAEDPADNASLGRNTDRKLELAGWKSRETTGSLWDSFSDCVGIPVRTAYGGVAMTYRDWYGVDRLSLMPDDSTHKLELKGWRSEGSSTMTPLAEAIKKTTKGTFDDYELVVRNASKGLNYVSLGTLDIGGNSPVDGSSITTNSEHGASSSGVASLHGWSDAEADDFPRKGSDGHLEWKSPEDLVDGTSLAWATVDGGKVFEVKDAHVYAGQHSRHYFGTSNDKGAALGWHELPNVTTNRVEGDGITIASTVDDQDPGLKRLGLLGWNKGWGGDPLFVVNAGGSIGYIPLPALTNLAACACTQKWENATAWIGGGAEISEDGGLTLPEDSLDEYLYNTLGYIYSTTPGNLYFDNDGEQIEASFTAPLNWADGDSVELTDEGAYQVAGWADASACAASMSAMLSQPTGSDATTHLLLAKKTDTGELHYVAIGDGVQSGAAVDDTTITTNTAHGAVTMGEASIYGWSGAANDTYLSKNEGGNLEWRKVDPVPGVDDASIVTNTAKQLTLNGYAAAENNAVPMKTAQGLSWLKASSATNLILAGAGINITDNGGGAITISAQSYESESSSDTIRTLTVVTAVRYDETTHKFQKKTRQLVFKGSLGTESEWTDVFEAVSHKSEHGVE